MKRLEKIIQQIAHIRSVVAAMSTSISMEDKIKLEELLISLHKDCIFELHQFDTPEVSEPDDDEIIESDTDVLPSDNKKDHAPTPMLGHLPPLKLKMMTLYPRIREVLPTGSKETVRLPRADFTVLYRLASNAGKEVNLGTDRGILTKVSKIRRALPFLKMRIESMGFGVYCLHDDPK